MKKLLLLMWLFTLAFAGCRTSKPQGGTNTTEIETVKYIVKDSIIREAGETVTLTTQIPCPEAVWQGEAKGVKTTLKATLKNGILNIDCQTDSLTKRIQWLEKELERKKETVITNIEIQEVPVNHTPRWMVYLILISTGLNIFFFRKQIVKFLAWLLP